MNISLKTIKENLISKEVTILEAIKKLNIIKYKTLIIIDKNKKILGTVTDGDIRRGLLKGCNINGNINLIANKNPVKKFSGNNSNKKINFKNVDVIPCTDKFGKIKYLEIFNNKDILDNYKDSLEIIFMAGGYGKRLMPYTKKTPKPLLKIKKKSVLEIAMENFDKYGFKDFYISIFYKANIIKKYFKKKKFNNFKIKYLEEKKPLGTGGCLSLLNYKNTKENILIYNGDVITDLNINNLLKFHQDTKSDITVCAKQFSNSSPYGQISFVGHKINKIIEKPDKKNFINAGIYLIKKTMIKKMRVSSIDMPNLIHNKIKSGCNVNIYPIYEYWTDMGNKDIFKELNRNK
jgi:dTDP-glucose pyrophosphorylase